MASGFDQTEANNILQASLQQASYVATTPPIMGRLYTVTGSATASGTEVVNGGGSTYAQQNVTTSLGAVASGTVTNSALAITWANLPTATITSLELWDSNATPKRKWWGALAASKSVTLGDSLTIATSQLTLTVT